MSITDIATGATATDTTGSGAAPGGAPSVKAGRLRDGELRAMVSDYLVAVAGQEMTPGQIARALSRSAGAVGNALHTLAGNGVVDKVSDKPVRYRAPAPASGAGSPSAVVAPAAPAAVAEPAAVVAPAAPVVAAAPVVVAVPAAVAVEEPVTGPVTRPNGMTYHPRTVAGIPDVVMLRQLRAAGVAALLYGPPGTGKTSLVEAAFPDLVTVQGDGETTVDQIIGDYAPTPEGGYQFVDGPLVRAMREGRPLFVDDATLISPTVLAVMYPAMDGRGQIIVKSNRGEVVTAAPGFYTIAGHNPGVHGAILTEALASRFSVHVQVSSDYELARTLGVDNRAVRVARNLNTRANNGEIGWVPQLRELLTYRKVKDAIGEDAAIANLIGAAPEQDREIVSSVVRSVYGREITPLALGSRI